MIISSKSTAGGAKAEIGDLVVTYNDELADGKVLIEADGSLVDGGTYPLLAAKLPKRLKTGRWWKYRRSEGFYPVTPHVKDDGSSLYTSTSLSGKLYEFNCLDNIGSSTLLNPATIGAEGTFCLATSKDHTHVTVVTYESAPAGYKVYTSHDSGVTFTSPITLTGLPAPASPVSSKIPYVVPFISEDGNTITLMVKAYAALTKVYFMQSTDGGLTFSEIWADATTYSSQQAAWGSVDSTGNKFLYWYDNSYVNTDNCFIQEGAVRTQIISRVPTEMLQQGIGQITYDGSRVIVSAKVNDGWSFFSKGLTTYRVYYTDDVGATWNLALINLSNLFPVGSVIQLESSDFERSTLSPDIIYLAVSAVTNMLSATALVTSNIIAINLITQDYELISSAPAENAVTDFPARDVTLTCTNASTTKEYLFMTGQTSSAMWAWVEIDYDKFLPKIFNKVEGNKLPYKLVADAP